VRSALSPYLPPGASSAGEPASSHARTCPWRRSALARATGAWRICACCDADRAVALYQR